MDYDLQMALRAIISGLHYAGTIDQRHITAIIQALYDAAEQAQLDCKAGAGQRLKEFAAKVAHDAQITIPSHDAPPAPA